MSKINKQSLADKTADAILNMIYCNNYSVGEKLIGEIELAEEFEVGRNTIREAIKILVSKNILEVKRGSGTFISKNVLTGDDPLGLSLVYDKKKMLQDIVQLRMLVEPKIASLAAQNATQKERKQLMDICDEMDYLFKEDKSYLLNDLEFHALIASLSKNQVMSNIVPSIHRALLLQHSMPSKLLGEKSVHFHREIAVAICENRGSDAHDLMLEHLMQNNERIKKY